MKTQTSKKGTMEEKDKKENFKTRELDARDYHKAHPYMKSLDKVLTHYFVTKTEDPAIHGEEYEEMNFLKPESDFETRIALVIALSTIIIGIIYGTQI